MVNITEIYKTMLYKGVRVEGVEEINSNANKDYYVVILKHDMPIEPTLFILKKDNKIVCALWNDDD